MIAEPTLNRRQVLRAGSVVLALPWLESLARAGETAPPQRMVCVCTSFGLYGPAFFPTKPGKDYEPSEYLQILGDLRNQFTVFSGISHPEIGGDHASEACFLTSAKHPSKVGFRNSVSLDYVAATHVGNATRFPLLTLSTQDASPLTRTPSGAIVPAMARPADVFAKLFLAGSKPQVEKEIARLKHGQSILDRMAQRLKTLQQSATDYDRQQIADYTEAVRSMEKRLVADEAWAGRPKPQVEEKKPDAQLERGDLVGKARQMFGLIRLALKTDSTRVASLFIRGAEEVPPIEGVSIGHHGLSHHGRNPGKIAQLKKIEKAEMEAFRDFLISLRDTKDGTGSLLDHTQVLIGSNLGDASGHGTTNLPILLAGGGFKHGSHIAGDVRHNTPLAKLFVSMLQRFGVETDRFGTGTGTITGLT